MGLSCVRWDVSGKVLGYDVVSQGHIVDIFYIIEWGNKFY